MQVNLIDYTGAGNHDPLYAARLLVYTKNTRLTQGLEGRLKVSAMTEEELKKELRYIAGTIRSSWEFIDFTFEIIGVTRAFTHQLVRTRTASYAQQAQRVVNMSGFDNLKPDTVTINEEASKSWDGAVKAIDDAYRTMIGKGIPAQDARGILPTNVLTNIIMKANLRTLADMIGKRDNLRAQGEYTDVIRAVATHVIKTMPWTVDFLYPDGLRTPKLDAIMKRLLGSSSPIDQPEINQALKEIDGLKRTWG